MSHTTKARTRAALLSLSLAAVTLGCTGRAPETPTAKAASPRISTPLSPLGARGTGSTIALATLDVPGAPADFAGHLYPLNAAGEERAPAIAWLRHWVFGDPDARKYFYGTDCLLCQSPWTDIQRKNSEF